MSISKPWVPINGNFKVYTTFNKSLGKTAPSAWKSPKTHLELTETWNPLHTLTPSSMNTQNRSKKYLWLLPWKALNSIDTGQKSQSHWKARIWLPMAFTKIPDALTKNLLKPSPVSEKLTYPLQNYVCFSLLTSRLEIFDHKYTPSHRPWTEAYYSKF